MKKIISLISLCLLPFLSMAENKTANMTASVSLSPACTIAVDDVDFGVYTHRFDNVRLSNLAVLCSKGVSGTISAVKSANSSTIRYRYMTTAAQDSEKLQYEMALAGKKTLGDGTTDTETIAVTGTGEKQNSWLGFSIIRGQYIRPGNYSDNVTLLLTY